MVCALQRVDRQFCFYMGTTLAVDDDRAEAIQRSIEADSMGRLP
ncbi:MAG: hypothetical protein N838_01605 [Thiohalocapsa sp. PB-PSB1]|jgi:hypothetical protein|nr:MAG: hypothetical protein N838_01605 [Thiohalocapsa sp. PB-PSB1]